MGVAKRCSVCGTRVRPEHNKCAACNAYGGTPTEPSISKECQRCGQVKKLTDFHKARDKPDGFATTCKSCINSAVRSRRGNAAAVDWTAEEDVESAIERERKRVQRVNDDAFDRLRAAREEIAGV